VGSSVLGCDRFRLVAHASLIVLSATRRNRLGIHPRRRVRCPPPRLPNPLWTLTDPTHIPQRSVTFLYNLWHPADHWYPSTSAADFPANDVVMHVDWFEFFAQQ
jgi:hypothetical protein